MIKLFCTLGDTPVIAEEKIEAYAVFSAMGPTYFWFQFYELQNIVSGFGLNQQEFQQGITHILNGSLMTMFSELTPEEVMDLVPVKPLSDKEVIIREIFREKLPQVYNRIRPIS